jgi:hypothetical protein
VPEAVDGAVPTAPAAPATSTSGPATRPRELWRVFSLGVIAFFLLAAAWAVITPYDGAYDEHDHVIRAAGVVRGELLVQPSDARNGRYQSVPRSLVPPNHECMRTGAPASCEGAAPADRDRVRVMTRAGHYNPVYYAVVGWPLAPFPTMTGVVLARLVNALLCAALLAAALVLVWSRRRYRFLLLAVLLSAAPMLLSLGGLVNPSGLEISAAVLLWAALTALARPDPDADPAPGPGAGPGTGIGEGTVVRLAGLAAATLAVARPAGLVIVAGIAVATWVALGDKARLRALVARREVRVAALVTAAAAGFVLVWAFVATVGSFGTEAAADPRPWSTILRGIVLGRFDYWLRQTVGVFGYATVTLPVWLFVTWAAVQGLLVLLGFALGPRRHAYTIVAIPLVCLLGGMVVELATARLVGAFMQGRYFLPWWVGMYFLAALAISTTSMPATVLRRVYGVFAVLYVVIVGAGVYVTLRVFQFGVAGSRGGPWDPPVPQVVPFLLVAAGGVAVAWLIRRYVRSAPGRPADAAARSEIASPAGPA